MNDAAAPGHVCSGIGIEAIDIVWPAGIGIPPIAAMNLLQMIVAATLDAKSSAETPKKARSEAMLVRLPVSLSRRDFTQPWPYLSW